MRYLNTQDMRPTSAAPLDFPEDFIAGNLFSFRGENERNYFFLTPSSESRNKKILFINPEQQIQNFADGSTGVFAMNEEVQTVIAGIRHKGQLLIFKTGPNLPELQETVTPSELQPKMPGGGIPRDIFYFPGSQTIAVFDDNGFFYLLAPTKSAGKRKYGREVIFTSTRK